MTTYTLTEFSDGDTLLASEMNDNFQYCLADTTTKVGALQTSVQGSINSIDANIDNLQDQITSAVTDALTGSNNKAVTANATVNRILTTTAITKARNGYVKRGDGIIVQWGGHNTTAADTQTITFPTAFSSNNYSITANVTSSADEHRNGYWSVYNRTTTGCTMHLGNINSANGYSWIAIGY